MMRRLRLLVLLARPAALVLFALFTALGVAQAGQAENRVLLGAAVAVVIAFVMCSVCVNDLADERIDRINLAGDHRRPLVVGSGTRRELTVVAGTAAALALGLSAALDVATFVVVAIGLVVSVGYSLPPVRLADRGAVAALILPACYVAVPFLVGFTAAGARLRGGDAVLLAGLYLGLLGRILLKDFRDVRGDALFGKRTFLVRHGRAATCAISAVAWVAGAALLAYAAHSGAVAGSYGVGTIATLVLLKALASDGGPRRDERIIAALAILGRGLLVTLLADLGMGQAHWAPAAIVAALAAWAALTGAATVTMLQNGPESRLALRSRREADRTTGALPVG